MRVAVTGGMGFIGTEVVSRLIIKGHDVVIVDFWDKLIREYEANRYPILECIYANMMTAESVIDPYSYLETASGEDVVIHLGACVDTTNMCDEHMVNVNVRYVKDLLRTKNSPLVFASSAAIYGTKGHPNNPYAITKAMGEQMIRHSDHQSACLRFFNVFGKFEHHKGLMASVPFKLAQAYRSGEKFEMHSLDASRDFIPVGVVADRVIDKARELCAPPGAIGYKDLLDVGSGQSVTFSDLDNFVMQACGQTSSCVKPIDRPSRLDGRYQNWTQAGQWIKNIGMCSPREYLEKYYGRR